MCYVVCSGGLMRVFSIVFGLSLSLAWGQEFPKPLFKSQSPYLSVSEIKAIRAKLTVFDKSISKNSILQNSWMKSYAYKGLPENKTVAASLFRACMNDSSMEDCYAYLKLITKGQIALFNELKKAMDDCNMHEDQSQCDKVASYFSEVEFPQSFDYFHESLEAHPSVSSDSVIYIVPIGTLSEVQLNTLQKVSEFLEIFFGVAVKKREPISDTDLIHRYGVRSRKTTHVQLNSSDINERFLQNIILKGKVAAVIGVSATDLYPGDEWSFVFGQAGDYRTNVWSMYRMGNEPQKLLELSLKIAKHELGHNLGIEHCTDYSCGMNGYMNLEDLASSPIEHCSEDLAKLLWRTKVDPTYRYQKLIEFVERENLGQVYLDQWSKALKLVSSP